MNFLIAALAVWRLTSLLVNEDGPFGVLEKLRHFIGVRWDERSELYGANIVARAFICPWCLSIWTGALGAIIIAPSLVWYPIYVLALSAVAIIIEETVNGES